MKLYRRWLDLSVPTKIYTMITALVLLAILQLTCLVLAVSLLDAARGFTHGESLWSKHHKEAAHNLQLYALTFEPKYYERFEDEANQLRLLTEIKDHVFSPTADTEGLAQSITALNRRSTIAASLRRFAHWFPNIGPFGRAKESWDKLEQSFHQLVAQGQTIKAQLEADDLDAAIIENSIAEIAAINEDLNREGGKVSRSLAQASWAIRDFTIYTLVVLILGVGLVCFYFTWRLAKRLSRGFRKLTNFAHEVGQGEFQSQLEVESNDEIGRLGRSLNSMAQRLAESIGARQQAESANQSKSLFLANMSHEIRTPLGVILGLADILNSEDLPEERRRRYLKVIENTGQNLNRIVNEILDISKVEAGSIAIEKTRFDFHEFIEDLGALLSISARKHNNLLYFRAQGEIPAYVYTDQTRLHQILTNVVNNSLKFTENGKVRVLYSWKDDRLHFQVEDSGIGILESQQSQLFNSFAQADAGKRHKYGGTGLGLALSKKLVETLGGSIGIDWSRPGNGTSISFNIEAPAAQGPQKETEGKTPSPAEDLLPQKSEPLKGRHVLLVDDSKDNQLVIELYLKKWGVRVTCADDGLEALQYRDRSHFDAILMDVQMPRMDGFEATRALRARHDRTPIIALTAHAMAEDKNECLAAGFDLYLTKPIVPQNLKAMLIQVLNLSSPALEADSQSIAP